MRVDTLYLVPNRIKYIRLGINHKRTCAQCVYVRFSFGLTSMRKPAYRNDQIRVSDLVCTNPISIW